MHAFSHRRGHGWRLRTPPDAYTCLKHNMHRGIKVLQRSCETYVEETRVEIVGLRPLPPPRSVGPACIEREMEGVPFWRKVGRDTL